MKRRDLDHKCSADQSPLLLCRQVLAVFYSIGVYILPQKASGNILFIVFSFEDSAAK
jgi:hypothetical protein